LPAKREKRGHPTAIPIPSRLACNGADSQVHGRLAAQASVKHWIDPEIEANNFSLRGRHWK
jgi:hypothetical protein